MPTHARFIEPRTWSGDELERDRRTSINRFVANFLESGSLPYQCFFRELYPVVESLFDCTDNLSQLLESVSDLSKVQLAALRFTAAPHLSEDNFKTIKDALVEELGMPYEDAFAEIFGSLIDPVRFPWLSDKREPTELERMEAIRWTTGLWAIQKAQTRMRSESSNAQEELVKNVLRECDYHLAPDTHEVILMDDIPRGFYRNEAKVVGQKCDIPVRLKDGRLLLIECKVSNSSTNSTKRLIRETCGKAEHWSRELGLRSISMAVLGGVFSLTNLKEAQNKRDVSLIWDFRMEDLANFVRNCN